MNTNRRGGARGTTRGSAADSSAKRNFSKSPRGGKSFDRKSSEGRKPFGEKPFGEKQYGEKKHGERSFEGKRSFGEKSFGAGKRSFGERPFEGKRAFGEKPFGAGKRSFGEKSFEGRKSSDDRAFEGKKSFGERNFEGKRAYGYAGGFEERKSYKSVQSYTPQQRAPKSSASEGVRLNKFISNSGICSRREADEFITAGLVSVNGVIVTELGSRVYPNDEVRFNNERIKGETKVYIVMNKPKDFVTTMSDPHAERTVMQLVEGKCQSRVYPVGRLDKATTGVLLLTNDGDLADKLTHPSFEKKKIYHVFLDKNFKQPDFKTLLDGVNLEDGFIQADGLSYIDEDKTQVGIEIHSGRNRIVRRVFEHLGYKVKKLDRVYFAGLTKKNLRRGQWRFLTEQEVAMLKMGSFE